ncbi:MAG: OprO/OprP family phosphate-selective porin, partial [Acidobacteria bacterium]|nr:OprO/OprP family phosphate-selective porin [Acidobacteriota bacterium]
MTPLARILLIVTFLLASSASAQDEPRPWFEATKISVLAFGDFYSILEHHNEDLEGRNGFLLRRIYLTFDQKLSPSLSARLRFELNQAGDFVSNTALEPFVKDAWVRWRRDENMDFRFGIWQNASFDTVEDLWGYRAVEKTPLDLQRWVPTRDLGIAMSGKFADPRFHYQAQVGNGSGTGTETNSGKKAAAVLGFAPSSGTIFELYADTEDRGAEDRTTLQAVAGYRGAGYRFGVQYAQQQRKSVASDLDLDLASVFAVWSLRENLNLIARVDRMFDPNPEGDRIAYLPFDPTAESTLLIAGVDVELHKNLGVVPNIEWITYESGPDG